MADRIGILGAGRMGFPIAARLAAGGLPTTVFDPVDRAAEALASGVGWARDAAELVTGADILLTVLPGRAELAAALQRELFSQLPAGAVWLDLTSGSPDLTETLVARAASRGTDAVAAPMGGGPADAAAGSLTLYAAGADAAVARVLPVLELLTGGAGGGIVRVGIRPADAQTVKLLANLLWFGQAVAATEALALGTRLGVDLDTLARVLPDSAGASRFLDDALEPLLAGDDLPTFGLARVVEELDSLAALAETTQSPFALSGLVTRLHHEALDRFGAVDGELLVARLIEERAGRPLRRPSEE